MTKRLLEQVETWPEEDHRSLLSTRGTLRRAALASTTRRQRSYRHRRSRTKRQGERRGSRGCISVFPPDMIITYSKRALRHSDFGFFQEGSSGCKMQPHHRDSFRPIIASCLIASERVGIGRWRERQSSISRRKSSLQRTCTCLSMGKGCAAMRASSSRIVRGEFPSPARCCHISRLFHRHAEALASIDRPLTIKRDFCEALTNSAQVAGGLRLPKAPPRSGRAERGGIASRRSGGQGGRTSCGFSADAKDDMF
jgi:hypothetical protein